MNKLITPNTEPSPPAVFNFERWRILYQSQATAPGQVGDRLCPPINATAGT